MLIPSRSDAWSEEDGFRVQEGRDAWSKVENTVQGEGMLALRRDAGSSGVLSVRGDAARSRGLPGRALTARGALLPRDHPALRLLQHLLPALRGAVHVVGLSPPRQLPGLQRPLHPRRHLQRRPPPVPLCLPDPLRPGGLPTPHHLGTVGLWGGSCAQGPRDAELPHPTLGKAARASLQCRRQDGTLAHGPGWGANVTSSVPSGCLASRTSSCTTTARSPTPWNSTPATPGLSTPTPASCSCSTTPWPPW